MESSRIQSSNAFTSQEVLRLSGSEVNRSIEAGRQEGRRSTSTDVQSTKRVTTGDFPRYEEVLLPVLLSARPGRVRPGSHEIDRHLSSLVDTDPVDVQSLNGETREMFELGGGIWIPFS